MRGPAFVLRGAAGSGSVIPGHGLEGVRGEELPSGAPDGRMASTGAP